MSLKVLETLDLGFNGEDDIYFRNLTIDLQLGQSLMILADPPVITLFLLKICATLLPSSSGLIRWLGMFEGRPLGAQLMVLRRQIGLVHRGTSLVSNLTLLDNMVLGIVYRDNMSPPKAYPLATELLERFGLYDLRHLRPAELNYEKRRMGVYAREIMKQPKLYLLETPLLDLDEDFALVMNAVNQEIEAGRASLIYSDLTSNHSQKYAGEILYLDHDQYYRIKKNFSPAETGDPAESGPVPYAGRDGAGT